MNCVFLFLTGSFIITIILISYIIFSKHHNIAEIGGLIIGIFILIGYSLNCRYSYEKKI